MLPAQTRTGRSCPAPEDVNEEIRRLMDQPPTQARAVEYERLLLLWAQVARDGLVQAA